MSYLQRREARTLLLHMERNCAKRHETFKNGLSIEPMRSRMLNLNFIEGEAKPHNQQRVVLRRGKEEKMFSSSRG